MIARSRWLRASAIGTPAWPRAATVGDIRPLAESTDRISKIMKTIVTDRRKACVSGVPQQPADCPSQDLDCGVLAIAQSHGLRTRLAGVDTRTHTMANDLL